jgi:hypothetical protein
MTPYAQYTQLFAQGALAAFLAHGGKNYGNCKELTQSINLVSNLVIAISVNYFDGENTANNFSIDKSITLPDKINHHNLGYDTALELIISANNRLGVLTNG